MHFQPAPFWRRLASRLLDLVFELVLAFVLVVPVTLLAFPFIPLVKSSWWGPVGGGTCLFLAYVVLETFLLVRRQGQTLGKGLMGLRVIPGDPSRLTPLTLSAALVRVGVLLLPFTLFSIAGSNPGSTALDVVSRLGFALLVVSLVLAALRWSNRRAVHDYVAGTRVVLAAKRSVVLREDLRMMVPGRVDMTKRA